MYTAFRKDIFRKIKKTLNKFLSIFFIVALGVGFFAGLKATGSDMKLTADQYWRDTYFYDIRLVSTLGLTDADAEAIRTIDGVTAVMPAQSYDTIFHWGSKDAVVRVASLPKGAAEAQEHTVGAYLNRPVLKEGRLPSDSSECAVVASEKFGNAIRLGDVISISPNASSTSGTLLHQEYTVVGFVDSPSYISFDKGSSSVGSGTVEQVIYVPEDAFARDYYSELFITVRDAGSLFTYSAEYEKTVEEMQTKLEALAPERTQARYKEQKDALEKQLEQLLQMGLSSDNLLVQQCRAQIAQLEPPQWIFLGRDTNVGYVSFENDADRVDAIASVFPVFFVLVAALVCLTTMTRMVEEERTQIGTLKALGYGTGRIAFKYLAYAVLACLGGSLFGVLVGFWLFPTVIFNAYAIMYVLPPVLTPFHVSYALLSSLAAVLCIVLATLGACLHSLREMPAALMQPKAPKAGKRILLERIAPLWRRIRFTQKVTARNLFRYKKRFLMTVIGIAGCTALLLTGFGLKDSISDIVGKQYETIALYDMQGTFTRNADSLEQENVKSIFQDTGRITEYLTFYEKYTEISANGVQMNAYVLVPSDPEKLPSFLSLHTRLKKQLLTLGHDQVIVTEKLARELDLSVGSSLSLQVGTNDYRSVSVSGIAENYVYHYVYLSPALYESVYGQPPEYNNFFCNLTDDSPEARTALSTNMLNQSEIASIRFSADLRDTFDDIISSLNLVVLVLILCAALLAFIVLYNLTNINLTERQREVATIKVLGFYDGEVSAYIYRETAVLTVLGALFGLVLGIFLHQFVVSTAEVDIVMFGREIKAMSYVWSFLLTLTFAAFVNFVMHFRIKRISMVESLKSVE